MFPGSLGPPEMLVIMVLAVLLFGKRLPEVGRSLGKGITEFKKGLRGEDDDRGNDSTALLSPAHNVSSVGPVDYQVPKFVPPTQPPVADTSSASAEHVSS
jgi:sec-independent protein translocase protein TatA